MEQAPVLGQPLLLFGLYKEQSAVGESVPVGELVGALVAGVGTVGFVVG